MINPAGTSSPNSLFFAHHRPAQSPDNVARVSENRVQEQRDAPPQPAPVDAAQERTAAATPTNGNRSAIPTAPPPRPTLEDNVAARQEAPVRLQLRDAAQAYNASLAFFDGASTGNAKSGLDTLA